MSVETAHETIVRSSIFRLDGPDIDLAQSLIDLANAIADDPRGGEELSRIGECDMDLFSVVVGGYWCMTEWHGGQWSTEYAALCALGRIYTPGMGECGPDPDTCEHDAYVSFCEEMETE